MTLQITSNPWNAKKKNISRVNNFIHFETMEISYSSDISELSVTPSILVRNLILPDFIN